MAEEMKEVLVRYTETYGDTFTIAVPKDATPEQMEEAWHEALSNGDISLEKVEMIESDYVFEEIGAGEDKQEQKSEALSELLDKLVYRTDYELLKEYKEALHANKTASLDAFSEIYDLLDLLDAIGKATGLSAAEAGVDYDPDTDIKPNLFLWEALKKHIGHNVQIVTYGDSNDPADICLECEDCGEVVLDAEIYTLAAREDA